MADNISWRRLQTNKFYTSVLSLPIAILAFVFDKEPVYLANLHFISLLIAIMGIIISIVWSVNINSYRQLNTGKFKVIHDMEKELAYACYSTEWELLSKGKNSKKYLQLTKVERIIPLIFSIPYWLLLLYALYYLLF